jgi:hypothetical protein
MSDIYSEFLDYAFTFTVKNADSEWTEVFTVGQLESLFEHHRPRYILCPRYRGM